MKLGTLEFSNGDIHEIYFITSYVTNFYFRSKYCQTMTKSLNAVVKLVPYISNELKYIDPKNKENINQHLHTLLQTFKGEKHNKDFKKIALAPSYSTIKEHLQETIDSFNSSYKDFSFAQARSITPLCLSCHNQIPKEYKSSFSLGIKKIKSERFKTDFEYAEFLYLVRNYSHAEKYYLKVTKKQARRAKASKRKRTFNPI